MTELKHPVPRSRRKRFDEIENELMRRCPEIDEESIATAARVMTLAGIKITQNEPLSYDVFDDCCDYRLPDDDVQEIADHCCRNFHRIYYVKRHYSRKVQREVFAEYLRANTYMTMQIWHLWYAVPHSRTLILERLESIEDLGEIVCSQIPALLKVKKPNEPWAGRKKALIEKWFKMIPKDYGPGKEDYGWRPGLPLVYRVYDTILDVYAYMESVSASKRICSKRNLDCTGE